MSKNNTLKATIASVAAASLLASASFMLAGCDNGSASNNNANNTNVTQTATNDNSVNVTASEDKYATGIHHVVMNVEGYDPINIEVNSDAAPISGSNFMHLVEDGYYDGLTFYRFQDGFCMQGGTAGNSPSGNDSSLQKIKGEFAENGVENPLADDFKRGIVAMARTMDPNSAGSTFFVTLDTSDAVSVSLNGKYAAFGVIDEMGMSVIDKIVADRLEVPADQMGVVTKSSDQAVITSIEVID